MKTSIEKFNALALQKSDIKPFKLTESKKGKRVWKIENGLIITAIKIGSREYYELSIINGEKIGDINRNGETLKAKEVQQAASELASKYNFNYIKRQVKTIQQSEAGKQLRKDWEQLRERLTGNHANDPYLCLDENAY